MSATLPYSEIQLFNALRERFGDREAEATVSFLKESVKQEIATQIPNIATKDFVDAKISGVETKIAEAKFQLILWAFVFWATQLGAMFAFIKFFK